MRGVTMDGTNEKATGISGGGASGAVTSNAPLSSTQTGASLSAGRFLAGSLDASGSFQINGTTIQWSNGEPCSFSSLNTSKKLPKRE